MPDAPRVRDAPPQDNLRPAAAPDTLALDLPDRAAADRLGRILGETLGAGAVLLLSGELGAGKTTLVQAIAAGLGIAGPVASPTFVLVNEYDDGRLPLYHFDLYRLDATEAARLDPDLYWEGDEVEPGLVAIEWADRLDFLPPAYLRVALAVTGPTARRAELAAIGAVPGWPQARSRLAAIGVE